MGRKLGIRGLGARLLRLGWMPGHTANVSVARPSPWWARTLGAMNLAKNGRQWLYRRPPHAREGCTQRKGEAKKGPDVSARSVRSQDAQKKNSPVQSSVVLTCGARREVVPATLRHRGQDSRSLKVQCAWKSQDAVSPKGTDLSRTPRSRDRNRNNRGWSRHRLEQGSFLG